MGWLRRTWVLTDLRRYFFSPNLMHVDTLARLHAPHYSGDSVFALM